MVKRLKRVNKHGLKIQMRTLEWDEKKEVVKLIDQTLLPGEYKIAECKT